jgi:hypothetical protein
LLGKSGHVAGHGWASMFWSATSGTQSHCVLVVFYLPSISVLAASGRGRGATPCCSLDHVCNGTSVFVSWLLALNRGTGTQQAGAVTSCTTAAQERTNYSREAVESETRAPHDRNIETARTRPGGRCWLTSCEVWIRDWLAAACGVLDLGCMSCSIEMEIWRQMWMVTVRALVCGAEQERVGLMTGCTTC